MSIQPTREPITVRLFPDPLARVKALATVETEGNLSLMVRKLLDEALAARDREQAAR